MTVSAEDDLQLVVDLLGDEERDDNRLPVLDGDRLVGIITRQDVLGTLAGPAAAVDRGSES